MAGPECGSLCNRSILVALVLTLLQHDVEKWMHYSDNIILNSLEFINFSAIGRVRPIAG